MKSLHLFGNTDFVGSDMLVCKTGVQGLVGKRSGQWVRALDKSTPRDLPTPTKSWLPQGPRIHRACWLTVKLKYCKEKAPL